MDNVHKERGGFDFGTDPACRNGCKKHDVNVHAKQ